jgi:hypothetical protein
MLNVLNLALSQFGKSREYDPRMWYSKVLRSQRGLEDETSTRLVGHFS